MCGIAGQIGRDPRVIQGQYAAYCAMQQTLSRRGPDQRGMFISGLKRRKGPDGISGTVPAGDDAPGGYGSEQLWEN